MNRDPVRVGVIGVGHLGRHHARIYSTLPGVCLVGVSDRDSRRGSEIGAQCHVPAYEDYHDLVKQVDAVSVAVPTSLHGDVVKECLRKGLHVLVEKPIASDLEAGRGMVSMAREQGVRFQVGHVERFNPLLDLIRPVIEKPRFIQCNRLAPYQVRGTDVDVVLDLMVHDLDIVLSWSLGSVTGVDAVGARVRSMSHDFVKARVEFANGCVAEFTASRVSTNRLRNFCVDQPNLYLSADYQTRQGILCRRKPYNGETLSVMEEPLQGGPEDALTRELEAFVRSIRDGIDHGVSGEEGFQALELAYGVLSVLARNEKPVMEEVSASPRMPLGMN